MTELSEGMHRLINPWHLTITVNNEERAQEFPPLADMLADHVFPNSGKTVGGASAPNTRSVLDVKSLDLLEHITDVTRAWLQEWGVPRAGELKLDLRAFWDRLHALKQSTGVDDPVTDHLAAYPDTWAVNIWDLIEPPVTRPLRNTECPKCGNAKFTNGEGDRADNLLITYRTGHQVTAECRVRECGGVWVGAQGLADLGRELGIEFNAAELEEPAPREDVKST